MPILIRLLCGSGGFSSKADHATVGRGDQRAEAMRFFHRHLEHRDGAVRFALLVKGEHRVVVLLVDVVAGEDEQRVGAPVGER